MLFLQRYQLKRLLSAGEINTFSGLQLAPEQEVYLHMVANGRKNSMAENLLHDLLGNPQLIPEVIEVGELAGTWFIVTEPIEGFTTFREWLQKQSSPSEQAPPFEKKAESSAPPVQSSPIPVALLPDDSLPPGEFTRLFSRPDQSSERTVLFSVPAKEPKNEEGDFTRFFGSRKSGLEASPAPSSPAAKPADVDEFEAVFPEREPRKAITPVRPAAPAVLQADATDWKDPLAPSASADEMPDFFNSPYEGHRVDVDRQQAFHSANGARESAEPFREAGEFTRVFGPRTPLPEEDVSAPPARNMTASSASCLFETQNAKRPVIQSTSDGGSYTKVITPKPRLAAAVAQPTEAAAPEPTNNKLRIGLIIVGAVCGVALLSAVLFLIFRRL